MHIDRMGVPLLVVALGAAPVEAGANLAAIERSIGNQPEYQQTPAYCLLVLGPEAQMRKWLVLDGPALYVDHNGNGDLTDAGERVLKESGWTVNLGDFPDADGQTRQGRLYLSQYAGSVRMVFSVGERFKQYVGHDMTDRLQFAARPADAPIVHFGGPLTFRWFGQPPALVAGQRCRFFTALGTPGLGAGTFAAVQCCSVPYEAKPFAVIDYPHRDLTQPPIQEKVNLGAD